MALLVYQSFNVPALTQPSSSCVQTDPFVASLQTESGVFFLSEKIKIQHCLVGFNSYHMKLVPSGLWSLQNPEF